MKDRINDVPHVRSSRTGFGSCVPHTTRPQRENEVDKAGLPLCDQHVDEGGLPDTHLSSRPASTTKNPLTGPGVQSVKDVAFRASIVFLMSPLTLSKGFRGNFSFSPFAVFLKPKSIESLEMNKRMNDRGAGQEAV